MKHTKILVLIICLFFACKNSNKDAVDNYFKECGNNFSIKYVDGLFNVYDYHLIVEEVLIENNFIKIDDKGSYKKIFKLLEEGFKSDENNLKIIELYEKINKKLEYHYMLNDPGVLEVPFVCVLGYLKSDTTLSRTSKMYSDNLKQHLKNAINDANFSLTSELIDMTSDDKFANFYFRSPIYSILYFHLESYSVYVKNR